MKFIIFIYIASIIIYAVTGIYTLKEDLMNGYEYSLFEFIFFFIIVPIIPFLNGMIAIILIGDHCKNHPIDNIFKKELNTLLRKIFKIN